MSIATKLNRRTFLAGTAGSGLLLAAASAGVVGSSAAAASKAKMTMYKHPGCNCCGKWADAARAQGYEVAIVPTDKIGELKAKLNIPEDLRSCHTTVAAGYILEGHVPFDAVKRLLAQRPNVKGIAVPGMPAGSPGMETADGTKQAFKVYSFGGPGKTQVFQQ